MATEIAIIGMSGLYPDARSVEEFAANLNDAVDSVRTLSADRLGLMNFTPSDRFATVGAVSQLENFDHEFFNISLREAEYMDPHQRLLLQLAHAAIENSGQSIEELRDTTTGVFVSMSNSDYYQAIAEPDPVALSGNLPSALAGRIAYQLGLCGPAMVIDAACASSLVAVLQACDQLALGHVESALAGGINLFFGEDRLAGEVGITASDGKCKTFDAAADGAGWGEGGGMMLLTPLERARELRLPIHAVIKGGAINQDAHRGAGITAPSPVAQAEVISTALRRAQVSADTIGYLEAHGTGTALGDPIELQGLQQAFSEHTDGRAFCPIGSVKTNIGHLMGAAGIAGLTKAVISLKQKKLFPSLHYEAPNPLIDFEQSAFYVNTTVREWTRPTTHPRRAAVSSFGLAGTNAHIVLEEAADRHIEPATTNEAVLVTVSAKTGTALDEQCSTLADHLDRSGDSIADIAYTLNKGRSDYRCRFATWATTPGQLAGQLRDRSSPSIEPAKTATPQLVLVLEGGCAAADIENYGLTQSLERALRDCRARQSGSHVEEFALLWAIHDDLSSAGVTPTRLVGTGIGAAVADLVLGRLSLDAALDKAATLAREAKKPDLDRFAKLVDQWMGEQPAPVFVVPFADAVLPGELDRLANRDHPNMTVVDWFDRPLGNEARPLDLLYVAGIDIDWQRHYEGVERRRVELSTYRFAARRCWNPGIFAARPGPNDALAPQEPAPAKDEHRDPVTLPADGQYNDTERALAEIWAAVLKVDRLDLDSDYFDLGGHSLNGTQVLSRVEEAFGVRLDFEEIYDFPTLGELARQIDLRRDDDTVGNSDQPDLPVVADAPLSFTEQRLWFLDQMEPGGNVYNIPLALRIKGAFRPELIGPSLAAVGKRHDALRTVYPNVDGQAQRVVLDELEVPVDIVDLDAIDLQDRDAEIERLSALEAGHLFDLGAGPLVRARIVRLAADDHLLLVTMHHIISDLWSTALLVRELTACYEAIRRGCEPDLPAVALQYGEFARQQRERLQGPALERLSGYWKEALGDAPALLTLPTDKPRAAVQSYDGRNHHFRLPDHVASALKQAARRENATLFMLLMAGLTELLRRYSGETAIPVGTPVASRHRVDTENTIGFFANTLVIKTDVDGDLTAADLIARVRRSTLGAYAHQEMPFEKLLEEVHPQRSLSHSPLFQVMLVLQNIAIDMPALPGLSIEATEPDIGVAQFDLTVVFREDGDGLQGRVQYNTDLFEAATIERLVEHLTVLLEAIGGEVDRHLSEIPVCSSRERALVIEDWNATDCDYAQGGSTLPGLIWSQGQRTPEATAVIDGDRELSYAQLLSRADGLACELSRRGVSSNDVVAVCAQRSAELAIGLLAVMRAGATYLPLDPQLPDRRIEQMVSDSASVAIVADESLEARVAGWSLPVVSLQGDYPAAAGWQAPAVTGEMGAYLIYTSGSTGVPKGVLIEHRGIVNRLLWMQARFGLDAGDRVLQKTPYGFDVSVWEFFWPLLNGATLVMARAGGHGDPQYLVEAVQRHAITTMHFVPSMLSAFLGTRPPLLSSLRRVICSGEALTVDQVQRFNASQSAQLHNLYGPTEASVDVSHWACPREEPLETVPIGYPIANTQLYVLDAALQPLPVGAVGELYIGGVGLARGYHGRGSLTASAFVPNPYGQPGTRLYRSGDRVRLRGDGAIEYLGRVDHQVKIRGFRIETGEIESVLVGHDEVDEAVVVAHEHAGRTVLVGYVVGAGDVEALREHLRARLPDYMVPAQLMRVERLPLTANGKLDRRALPAPQWGSDEQSYQGPRDEREAALVEIWQSVLGLERVGIDDNFFELGGDSIVCVQVVARANEAGLHLTPRQMFEHQSIAALAAVAATTRQVHADQEAVTGPVKLTPIQHWLLDQSLPQPGHWNQAVMLAGEGELDRAALTAALEALYAQHDVLRHRFEVGSKVQEGLAPTDRPLVVQFEDLSDCAAHEREAAIASCVEQAQRSLDLDAGRLLQVCALQWSGQWRLLLVIHHLVVDGVSWRILLEQLQLAYAQRLRDEPIELPAKTTSYQYWAQRLSEHVHEGGFDEQLPYWLEVTGVEALRLPGIAQANVEADAEVAQVRLSAQQTGQLLHEVPEAYNTNVQDLLLAAVAGALLQWTDTRQAPVLIDLEGHGREDLFDEVDLSRTVGWFTTLYPVCIAAAQSDDPGEALRRVKETLRAVPDRGIGYGALRYLGGAGPAARLAGRSAAQISFNYLGVLDHVLDRDGTFAVAPESTGAGRDPKAARAYELDFSADVSAGRLQLRCHYAGKRFTRSSIERLLELATQGAAKLIAHCIDPDTGAYTPSDFPDQLLSDRDLSEVLAQIG